MPPSADPIRALVGAGTEFPLVEIEEDGRQVLVFDREPRTLRDAFLSCEGRGDEPAIIYEDESWSYARLWNDVLQLAHSLHDRFGVRAGDRVGIVMRNYPEWVLTFWATQLLGATTVAFNAWLGAQELAPLIQDAEPMIIVADAERVELFAEARPIPFELVGVRAPSRAGVTPFADLLNGEAVDVPPADVAPGDLAVILFTSGTTGRPKASTGTHRNLVSNLLLLELRARAVRSGTPSRAPSLVTTPIFHIGGLAVVYSTLWSGRCLILLHRWNADRVLELVDRHGVESLAAPPLAIREILDRLRDRPPTSLRAIGAGAAPSPPTQVAEIADLHGGGHVIPTVTYGLTETNGGVLVVTGAEFVARPTTVGRLYPTIEHRIVDPELRDVPRGGVGELLVRGPQISRGYLDPVATASSFVDGWFRTGDLFREDDDGFFHLVGRLKDIVIRAGENISSGEVESALGTHPAVAESAVVGFPHATLSEEVGAIVRLREGAVADEAELQQHVAERLARFKVPTIVRFVDQPLPRNATGKVDKAVLRRDLGIS